MLDTVRFVERSQSGIFLNGAALACYSHRDGGLKRQKVKDSYKEEQQKMYSSIIVGQNDSNSPKTCSENTGETGDTGLPN